MLRSAFLLLIVFLTGADAVLSQQAGEGAILIKGKSVNAGDKDKPGLARKRFYVFAGGLKENAQLIERIRSAEITSRDCFYTEAGASACLIKWLQQENCETAFCRKVEQADIAGVPEFQAAYDKSLAQYGKRPDVALDWLVTNLSPNISNGFYLKQKTQLATLLAGAKPIQSLITTKTAAEAMFVGIPAVTKTKYLISNVLPVEVGSKSYAWACELDVEDNKTTSIVLFAEPAKTKKNCVLAIRDLKVCATEACAAK
jgi:hypothetical protein